MSILNHNKKYVKQPFFFGEEPGIYDSINLDDELYDIHQRAVAQIWQSTEFNFATCKGEFEIEDSGKDLMVETLKFQWQADSLACNLYTLLQPFITNDQLTQLILFNTYLECLHKDHQVLTPGGWVNISEINVNDIVAQFEPETKTISFVKVLDTISKPAKEGLIKFKSKYFEQMVTPKHRMPIYSGYEYVFKEGKIFKFFEAKDAPTHGSVFYPVSGFLSGENKYLTLEEKFWIAFQADGSIGDHNKYTGKRVKGLPYKFSFKKQRKINEFDKLLKNLGWHNTWCITSSGYKSYTVYVPFEHLKDNLVAKNFDWIDYSSISSEWCEEFLNYIMIWDGCLRPTKNCLGTYVNTNLKAVERVQTISHLAGYSGTYYEAVLTEGKKQTYHVTVTKRQQTAGNVVNKTYVEYTDNVYCITVPSGAFITKYNNTISITGNCVHSETYSEIVKNAFQDPLKTIEELSTDEVAIGRLAKIEEVFFNLRQAGLHYSIGKVSKEDIFIDVYKGVVALYLLERVQFVCSFAVTFSLGELGRFAPIVTAVRKICADEMIIHAETDLAILKNMRSDNFWETVDKDKLLPELDLMVNEVIQRECDWVDTVFEGRTLPGLTPDLLKEWALFNAQVVKKELGLPIDSKHKQNPLPFLNNYLTMNKLQSAPQEQELGQYLVGGINNDLENLDVDLDF